MIHTPKAAELQGLNNPAMQDASVPADSGTPVCTPAGEPVPDAPPALPTATPRTTGSLLILAAGASRRMGQPKPLLRLQGKTLLEWHLDSAEACGLHPLVVLGYHGQQILDTLAPRTFPHCWNPEPSRGQFSSVQTGLQALADAMAPGPLLLTPIDCPPVPIPIILELLAHWQKAPAPRPAALIPHGSGQPGHPILLNPNVIAHLLAASPESALDRALATLGFQAVEVLSPAILLNLNTPQDLETYLRDQTCPATRRP